MKIFWRKFHRWLGLVMAVQITAWMVSGLYFSIYPIEQIRGEHLTRDPNGIDAAGFAGLGKPVDVVALLDDHFAADWSLESAAAASDGRRVVWRLRGTAGGKPFTRVVDQDGRLRPQLTMTEAADVARGWLYQAGRVAAVDWVTTVAPGSEFRGGRLPAWRVTFSEPEALHLYLDPWSGDILARRTTRWRLFDFFWMLHVMDFTDRDDFSHPLLQLAATLGLLVALGGMLLWAVTTRLRRKRSV